MHAQKAGAVIVLGGLFISSSLFQLSGLTLRQLKGADPFTLFFETFLPGLLQRLGSNRETAFLLLQILIFLLLLFRELFFDSVYPVIQIPPLSKSQDADVKYAPKPTKRICVVTGAAGFTGRWVVEELLQSQKYDIIKALDKDAPTFQDPRVINIKGNILDLNLLIREFSGVEAVFHVASLVSLLSSRATHQRLTLSNVLGCRNVIEACIRRGVSRLIYTSTTAVVGDAEAEVIFQSEKEAEEAQRSLSSWYSLTKRKAERMVLKANGVAGLRTVSLRPYRIYGEGDYYVIGKYLANEQVVNTQPTSTMYVRNLAHWELLADAALERNPSMVSGQAYFVADDQEMVTREEFHRFIISTLHLPDRRSNLTLFRLLSIVIPFIDWYVNGSLEGGIWGLNNVIYRFSTQAAYFGIEKGIRELGYRRKYGREDIARNLRKYYGVKEA